MNSKARVKRALPYSLGLSLLNILVSLLGMVLLVRYLSGTEFAVLAILNGLPVMINMYIAAGYNFSITRFVPDIRDKQQVGRIVWQILLHRLLIAAAVCLVLVLVFDLIDVRFGLQGYRTHFTVYQAAVLAQIGFLYLTAALNARFKQKTLLAVSIVHQSLRLAVIYAGVYAGRDLLFFIAAFTLIHLLTFLFGAVLFGRRHGWPRLPSLLRYRYENREIKSYRRLSYFNQLGTSFLSTDIDRYILAYLSNSIQVAIYALATQILRKALQLMPSRLFNPVIEPAFYARYDESGEAAELNRMFQFIFNINLVVSLLYLSLFIPLGRDLLVLVFKQDYVGRAYWPLLIYLVFMLLYFIPLGLMAKAVKKPQILLVSKISSLFNLAIGIPMAYFWGAPGIALATAVSMALKSLIIYILLHRLVAIRIPWRALLTAFQNGLVTALVLAFLRIGVGLSPVLLLIAGAGLYLLLSYFFNLLDDGQKKLVRSLLPERFQGMAGVLLNSR